MKNLDIRTVRRIKSEARDARIHGRDIDDHNYGVPEKKGIWDEAYKNALPNKFEGLDS